MQSCLHSQTFLLTCPVLIVFKPVTRNCRPGGLAYVVAFASSGAKDVTQRYVGSVLAADKMRDNVWWEETLRPLRKHEVLSACDSLDQLRC